MATREFTPNQKYTKSYKSETALLKAIEKNGFEDLRYVRYTFEDGRITPVFIRDTTTCPATIAHRGFCVVG